MRGMLTLLCAASMIVGADQARAQDIAALLSTMTEGRKFTERLQALDQAVATASPDERLAIMEQVVDLTKACDPKAKVEGLPVNEQQHLLQGLMVFDHFIANCCLIYAEDERTRLPVREMLFETSSRDPNVISGATQGEAYERLMEISRTEEERKEVALRIVERGTTTVGYLAADYLRDPARFDKHVQDRLRRNLRESLRRGHPNRLVLVVLGHVGDKEILPELEAFGDHSNPDVNKRIRVAIWQIKIQQKPGELLKSLSEARTDANPIWIVHRAMELETPKEKLRAALQAYYQKCDPERLTFSRLAGLDKVVVELGVLEQGELPKWDR